MDRRDFFKLLLTTTLVSPLVLSPKKSSLPYDVYLISDNPQDHLPFLLKELRTRGLPSHDRFSFVSSHPRLGALSRALQASGIALSSTPSFPAVRLSSVPLHPKARPSFTLLLNGKIQDIRSSRLSKRWAAMHAHEPSSSTLTIARFFQSQPPPSSHQRLCVYKDGEKIESLDLGQDLVRAFAVKRGEISIHIKEGRAFVEKAPCDHKVCCSASPISLPGERVVCAPSRFFIEVSGFRSFDTFIG